MSAFTNFMSLAIDKNRSGSDEGGRFDRYVLYANGVEVKIYIIHHYPDSRNIAITYFLQNRVTVLEGTEYSIETIVKSNTEKMMEYLEEKEKNLFMMSTVIKNQGDNLGISAEKQDINNAKCTVGLLNSITRLLLESL